MAQWSATYQAVVVVLESCQDSQMHLYFCCSLFPFYSDLYLFLFTPCTQSVMCLFYYLLVLCHKFFGSSIVSNQVLVLLNGF